MPVPLDTLTAVINLTERKTDSLTTVTMSNTSNNPIVIDSIKTFPGAVFTTDKNNAVIMPGEEVNFKISFNLSLIDTGFIQGTVYFFRRNEFFLFDTLIVGLNLYIQKPVITFSDLSLSFDSTAAGKSVKELSIRNFGGNINLVIDSVVIVEDSSPSFRIIDNPAQKIIGPGGSASYFIEFTAETLGHFDAALLIRSNAYPDTLVTIPMTGSGRGGELSPSALTGISNLSGTVFEALTDNNRTVFFENTGNAPLDVSISFSQNYFKVESDFLRNFTVHQGNPVSLKIIYSIPDFNESNIDTMRIVHNGFGEDTLIVFLEGTFDSLTSTEKLRSELRLNGGVFSISDKVINENTPIVFALNPDLLSSYHNLNFRINYYTGGHGNRISAVNDGNFNYTIPRELVNERGLILSGQLLARDAAGAAIDSITIFTPINIQVILKDYKTIDINVPRSIPAERAEDANTKWIMFGFPFEVPADSVFKNLGGIGNMQDGEWIVYSYNFNAPDSFVIFDNYSFNPATAYFAAQSLMDTLKISYQYNQNLRTVKLTDSVLALPGTHWKTISSPFLFDVETDPSVVLRRYDTNNKTYRMTNIMSPGEGYFVEPSVSQITLKTFGEYNPLFYPKIMADIGWHIKLEASDKNITRETILSVESKERIAKISGKLPLKYASSPELHHGPVLYINGDENERLEAAVKEGMEGAVFNMVLLNNYYDNKISLKAEAIGKFPENYTFRIYNDELKEIVSLPLKEFFLKKGKQYNFNLIVGTEKFVNNTLNELASQVPEQFALNQNYPNPFNPATTISYQVPENSFVNLKVYDILGKEIVTLINEEKPAGYYKLNFNGADLASGVYFLRMISKSAQKEFTDIKKMVFLK
ncbi:MAG: T9SS type A sorting domain-containing protein [Ignavibacteriaceae bacterium]